MAPIDAIKKLWRSDEPTPGYSYTVGKIAKALKVSQSTLEAWIRRDVITEFLSEPARRKRQFHSADVAVILIVQHLRSCGYDLDSIKPRVMDIMNALGELWTSPSPRHCIVVWGPGKPTMRTSPEELLQSVLNFSGPIPSVVDLRFIEQSLAHTLAELDK